MKNCVCQQHVDKEGIPNYEFYKITNAKISSYCLKEEPEVVHFIKTGFEDRYIAVFEDAYELSLGHTRILTKEEIKSDFGIEIDI